MFGKIIAFIFGSIVGSFLNVCIHRMPVGESIVWPSSHCPHCKKRIPAWDNIPFLSFILLGGRCRFCRAKISLRYPLVELVTAAMFVLFFSRFALSYEFFFYIILVSNLIVASFIDIKQRIIPDELSIGGMILGFTLSAIKGISLQPLSYNFEPLLSSLLGIIAGAAVLYATGFLFDLIYFKLLQRPPIQGETQSMGGGDIKLLAMIGAFLGLKNALFTFIAAPFLGLPFGIFSLATKKDHTIPYGPFLALAALISIFYSDKIIRVLFFPWM